MLKIYLAQKSETVINISRIHAGQNKKTVCKNVNTVGYWDTAIKKIVIFANCALPIPAKMSRKSFWTSDMLSKNNVLTSILMFFHQKFCCSTILLTFLLLTSFTVSTYHPSVGEVLPSRRLQCGIMQHFYQFLVQGQLSVEGGGFSFGSVSRSF